MSTKTIGILVGVAAVICIAIGLVVWYFGILNGEVRLANRYDAQFNVVETTLDTMRKTLINEYKITKESADQVVRAVVAQTEGRKGGGMFKSVTESPVSGMPLDMYKNMAAAIEGQLAAFKRSQDTLTDVWQQHKTYCETAPNSWFVGGKVKPKPEMISSSETKKIIETKDQPDNILE